MENIDLTILPDGFTAGMPTALEPLALTHLAKGAEAMVIKHHRAIILYHQRLLSQSGLITDLHARLSKAEACLPMIQTDASNAMREAQGANAAACAADGRAGACDARLTELTGKLNEYAENVAHSETRPLSTSDAADEHPR